MGVALASELSLRNLKKNKVRALTALVLSVGAVYTVFNAQYLRDPSWQGGLSLGLALVASCATAAYTAANFAGALPAGTSIKREDNVVEPKDAGKVV